MLRSSRSRSPTALVACGVAAVVLMGAGPSFGQQAGGAGDAPTVAEAEVAVQDAQAEHEGLELTLSELLDERDRLLRDLRERDDRRERATRDLIRARDGAQSLAVLAYIVADDGTVVWTDGPRTDDLYRDMLVRDGADARIQAASYYQDLRHQAGSAITSTLRGLEEIDARIAALTAQRDLALDGVRAASTDLEAARAEELEQERAEEEAAERQAAADLADLPAPPAPPATPSTPSAGGPWTPIGTIPGGPSPQQWAQLRNCESGGNYQAVSAGGTYRGAYQFDLSTWRTVGGTGDPIAASPAEQDHRAQLLWQSRGNAPWPICGRYLR